MRRLFHAAERSGLCGCGCGRATTISPYTSTTRGWVKGEPRRCVLGHRVAKSARTDPVVRFWSHVNKTDTCWLWTSARAQRYGIFRLVPAEPMRRAHRVSWEFANGPIPDGLSVLHNCPGGDNPLCVNPAHLFLGTQLDNMRDCSRKGRMGDRSHSAKLTANDVRSIRALAAAGRSMARLAREYGVSAPTVNAIVHRRKWRWVA